MLTGKKAVIFEKPQNKNIDGNGKNDAHLRSPRIIFSCLQFSAAEIVEADRQEQKNHIDRLAPGIEQNAGDEKDDIFPFCGYKIIHCQHNRQKEKQKCNTTK